jgi:hypothetical protein
VFILFVMIAPGSPAALRWPLEVSILATFTALGGVFWLGGRRLRSSAREDQRARLILERYAPDQIAHRGD